MSLGCLRSGECGALGVGPVFPEKDQAINYAENRASFRVGEVRILDSTGNVERGLFLKFDDHGMDLRLPGILNGAGETAFQFPCAEPFILSASTNV